MTDSEPSKHWDFLAEQLGAEPPPPEPCEEAASEGPEEAEIESQEAAAPDDLPSMSDLVVTDEDEDSMHEDAPEPRPPVRPKPAPQEPEKPSPAHWNSLAGQLGLEVPDEPVAEVEPQPELDDVEMADDAQGDSAPVDLDTLLSAASNEAADEPVAIDDESPGSQAARQAASLEFGFGIIDAIDTRDQSFIEEAEDAVNDEPEDDEPEDDDADEPAASVFEATTTVDETTPAAEEVEDERDATETADDKSRRRKRRRGRKRRPRDGRSDERKESAAEGSPEPTDQPSSDTSDTDAQAAPSDTGRRAESQGPSRKRRRPRRRPIVGVPDVERPAEVGEDEVAPVGEDEVAPLPPKDEQPAAGPPSESEPDSEAAPEQEKRSRRRPRQRESAAESSDEPESGRPSHRKIPSWAEAIGMVISTNEQARARSPDSGSRRRGRGKGRRPSRGKKS